MSSSLFSFHKLNTEGIVKSQEIAFAFAALLRDLEKVCVVGSREFSICKTKLEEACFYAKKSMAIDEVNNE